MSFGLVPPYLFVFFLSFFILIIFFPCGGQMIVITRGVSLTEMSSFIVMSNMRAFIYIKKKVVSN